MTLVKLFTEFLDALLELFMAILRFLFQVSMGICAVIMVLMLVCMIAYIMKVCVEEILHDVQKTKVLHDQDKR